MHGECACPGQQVAYECTTTGGTSTVWKANFFTCPNNAIPLRHSQFNSNVSAVGECNNRMIVANGLHVSGSNYTSQITITVSENMIGEMLQCVQDNGRFETIVGQVILENNLSSGI